MQNEEKYITAGSDFIIIETKGTKVVWCLLYFNNSTMVTVQLAASTLLLAA